MFRSQNNLKGIIEILVSDDRIIEYGIKEVVLDVKSLFQHVQINQTIDHGKMLILDGAVNLAESDTVAYTHQLMDLKNVRNFFDKLAFVVKIIVKPPTYHVSV